MRKRKEEEQSHPEEEEVIEADGRHIEVQLVQEKQPVILVEIVSALYLPSNDRFSEADPYIVVYFEEEEVHRTKAIWNARNPIWTVENGSLFLFQLPPNHDDDDNDDVEAPNNTNSSTTTTISNDHQKKSRLHFLTKTKLKPSTPEPHLSFVLKDYDPLSKNERIGEVKVPLKKLLAGTGKRKELPIETNVDFMNKSVRLGYTPPVLKSTKQVRKGNFC